MSSSTQTANGRFSSVTLQGGSRPTIAIGYVNVCNSGFGHDKSQAILPYRKLPNPPTLFFFGDGVSGLTMFILDAAFSADHGHHPRHVCSASCRCTVREETPRQGERSRHVLRWRRHTPHSFWAFLTGAHGDEVHCQRRDDQGRGTSEGPCVNKRDITTASWCVKVQ